MANIADLDKQLTAQADRSQCRVCRVLDGMSAEDRATMTHLIGRDEKSGDWRRSRNHLTRLFKAYGETVSRSSIDRHREAHA